MGAKYLGFKEDVRCSGFHAQLLEIMEAARLSAPELVDDVVFITSLEDGKHSEVSAHYYGGGVDIRTHGDRPGAIFDQGIVDEVARRWVRRMQKRLGRNYQVLYESKKSHIHAEWDLAP